ncbi:MAG: isochorismatase family protein [Rhodospirillum sp.]|nr:isochorismatase family protein [Rhodospirillum sp.]MCF8489966.1 isochorismatase family protein [Rhodospirillum sp.]MCF8501029.1 isochorismatase family protein [Rhodospirillum sp.]
MAEAKTLLALSGADLSPNPLHESAVVVIDAQLDYVAGILPLAGIDAALEAGAALLARAREMGRPVVHVLHKGSSGGLLDPEAGGRPDPRMAPRDGEAVVWKSHISGFEGTDLAEVLAATGVQRLILLGFMTHMCVSTTTRVASDRGYRCTVVAEGTATRDLPDPMGEGSVSARDIQRIALAELADLFAVVVPKQTDIPD